MTRELLLYCQFHTAETPFTNRTFLIVIGDLAYQAGPDDFNFRAIAFRTGAPGVAQRTLTSPIASMHDAVRNISGNNQLDPLELSATYPV